MASTRYLKEAALKRLALHKSEQYRAGKFTRVSMRFLQHLDAQIPMLVEREVRAHPPIGKTLMAP